VSQMLVGIDISLRSHHVQLMDEQGRELTSFSISNDLPGADTLIRKVKEAAKRTKSNSIHIGMEATSNLGWHLAHYLQDQFHDQQPKAEIYVLNARKIARFKKGYDTLPKNDRIDAWVIADHLRFGRLPYAMTETIQFEALQRLTRTRFHLMHSIARDKTYFLNQVFLKFSGLRQDNPFSSRFWQHQPGRDSRAGTGTNCGNAHGRTHCLLTGQRQKSLYKPGGDSPIPPKTRQIFVPA
jgi:hypothetical protein